MSIAMPPWHSTYHQKFTSLGRKAGACGAVAGLVAAVGGIVIFSSCLCLTLPGVNALTDVALPGILPGGLGLALSIPLFALTYRYALQKRKVRAQWMPRIKSEIEETEKIWGQEEFAKSFFRKRKDLSLENFASVVQELEKDKKEIWAQKFVDRLFSAPWSTECKRKLIMDLMKGYPDKESPENKMLTEALQKALAPKGSTS